MERLKVKALSSSPRTTKKRKKKDCAETEHQWLMSIILAI
jgi:hypothetical protein